MIEAEEKYEKDKQMEHEAKLNAKLKQAQSIEEDPPLPNVDDIVAKIGNYATFTGVTYDSLQVKSSIQKQSLLKNISGQLLTPWDYMPIALEAKMLQLSIYKRFYLESKISTGELSWEDVGTALDQYLHTQEKKLGFSDFVQQVEAHVAAKDHAINHRKASILSKRRSKKPTNVVKEPKVYELVDSEHAASKTEMLLFICSVFNDGVELTGPLRHDSNRVARHFGSDRIMRVCFEPASGSKSAFLNVLQNGLNICGRHYEFLAFSAARYIVFYFTL